jgi:regulator of protease activity HflC (stomatin/prohibitin superfamily)|nr:MAG TPA: Prohibitin-2 [Caudoviricetes sp.]
MIGAVVWSFAFGVPMYMVWQQQKAGEAELARAEQNRQVAVLEAKAKLDSAESLAQAEVKRAEGTAKANQIIGQSLKGNKEYIHWLWVDTLKDSKDQIIYIPTEAGVPITESFRLKESK